MHHALHCFFLAAITLSYECLGQAQGGGGGFPVNLPHNQGRTPRSEEQYRLPARALARHEPGALGGA